MMIRFDDRWEGGKQRENLGSAADPAAGELADQERMALDLSPFQGTGQPAVSVPEMIHPGRRVDQH